MCCLSPHIQCESHQMIAKNDELEFVTILIPLFSVISVLLCSAFNFVIISLHLLSDRPIGGVRWAKELLVPGPLVAVVMQKE
ncbi:hypothetical protein NQ317_007081 [Molorchus minor]|uniref:Uncharacterized protein n=1 Tax=Molorchus minor TaxID=1323400 RepID=A0ABQ9K4P7_9CUCU|nr:hypothetical protein NQ317_007081 [Molorchus minor]